MSTILGARGLPMVQIGGDRAHKEFTKGDIVVSLQWIDRADVDPEGPHPCMILRPKFRKEDAGVYVIPQRNGFAYQDSKGNPTAHALGAAFKAAIEMGFFPDQTTVHRILDAIHECMPDLIRMPSTQPNALEVKRAIRGIEVSASVGGRVLHQEVM
jgi:hypothetical protein